MYFYNKSQIPAGKKSRKQQQQNAEEEILVFFVRYFSTENNLKRNSRIKLIKPKYASLKQNTRESY